MGYKEFDQGQSSATINHLKAKKEREERILREAELHGEREEALKMLRFIDRAEKAIPKKPCLIERTLPTCGHPNLDLLFK